MFCTNHKISLDLPVLYQLGVALISCMAAAGLCSWQQISCCAEVAS